MALPLRPQTVTTCLRNAWSSTSSSSTSAAAAATSTFRHHQCQQTRGAKKMANLTGSNVHVRLLKNVSTFGRKGAVVPISMGKMRNNWFPLRIADYIPAAELKTLRANDEPMEREFTYGLVLTPVAEKATVNTPEMQDASMFQKRRTQVSALTPERSFQLLEIFVPQHLDFFRQPIMEEKPAATPPPPDAPAPRSLTGAAADLMAARIANSTILPTLKSSGPQAIYGSVSANDVLGAVRDSLARNDEAARIMLAEADIVFVGQQKTSPEEADATRVKHVGEYQVEITVKGAEEPLRRTVKVVAQEA